MPSEHVALNDTHLAAAVQGVIASKRIGAPVFVRLLLQGQDTGDALLAKLARLVFLAQGWIGLEVSRCQATGSLESGQVNLALTFAGGATALISYAKGATVGDGLDVMVLGNHGAIYHDGGAANLGDAALPITAETKGPLTVDLLRKALEFGRPITPTPALPRPGGGIGLALPRPGGGSEKEGRP